MKKVLKWIKKNMGLFIVLLLTIVLLIIILVIFLKMLVGNSSNNYGNRLEGINEVKIEADKYDEVENEIMDTELAEDVKIRLQGKIVYTTITLKSDTSVDAAKEIAVNTLDNYTEEELGFYDFSYFLKWEGEESDTVISGNKHHDLETITWIKG